MSPTHAEVSEQEVFAAAGDLDQANGNTKQDDGWLRVPRVARGRDPRRTIRRERQNDQEDQTREYPHATLSPEQRTLHAMG